jgi:hypothetical protein
MSLDVTPGGKTNRLDVNESKIRVLNINRLQANGKPQTDQISPLFDCLGVLSLPALSALQSFDCHFCECCLRIPAKPPGIPG